MPIEVKILLFFVGLGLLTWYIYRNPSAVVSRILLSWNGPFPVEGELQFKYQLRWAVHCFKWLVEIMIIWGVVYWLVGSKFYDEGPIYITALLSFALPLGLMITFVGSIGFLLKSAWYAVFKKDFRFSQELGNFIENA